MRRDSGGFRIVSPVPTQRDLRPVDRPPQAWWCVGVILILQGGCAGGSASPTPTELFYPRHGRPLGVGDAALLEGQLILNDDGCVFIEQADGSRTLPLWPRDTSPRWMNVFTVVGPGRELLFEANAVSRFAGSLVDRPTAEELVGPIPDACLADGYWAVTSN